MSSVSPAWLRGCDVGLAPRPGAPSKVTGTRDSGLGKEGKAAQRKRNKGSDTAHLTTSGSSGKALSVSQYPQVDWEDVKDDVVFFADLVGKISHTQLGGSGWATCTVNIPLEYYEAASKMHFESQSNMIYFRVYVIREDIFTGDGDADQQPA